MSRVEILIIGSNNKATGGIPRYIPEQVRHLPETINERVYDIGAPQGSGKIWFLKSMILAVFDAIKFPFRSRPDVVHIHTSQHFSFYRAAFYVLFANYVWRVPVLLHIHGSSFDEFVSTDSLLIRILQSVVYNATSKIVVLSQYWNQQLEPYTNPDKITIIPNAVNPSDYEPKDVSDPVHIVFVSNLIERKGIIELTDSLETVLDKYSTIRVSIAGKGPLSDRVEALEREYTSVNYLGYISEKEKYELLSSGSIFVLPAHAEGLPIAILEAMAGGNAIISTTVGSIPEVIDKKSGRLISPKDSHELTEKLNELIRSPQEVRAMGERNRQLIKEQYCWATITNELVKEYHELNSKNE